MRRVAPLSEKLVSGATLKYGLRVSYLKHLPSAKSRFALKQGDVVLTFLESLSPVTLTFPSTLSGKSHQDLADHLAIFMRKAERRAQRIAEKDAAQDDEAAKRGGLAPREPGAWGRFSAVGC